MATTESPSTVAAAEETAIPMGNPKTADERERRFVQYLQTLNKGELAELRLARMNRIANFRKALMQLVNEMVEARAEDLAAAMLVQHATDRPSTALKVERRKLPPRKPVQPAWVNEEGKIPVGKH